MTENKEHEQVREARDHYRHQLIDEMEAQRDYMQAVTKYGFRPSAPEPIEEKVRVALEGLVICRWCTWESLRELREVELAYGLHQKEDKDK